MKIELKQIFFANKTEAAFFFEKCKALYGIREIEMFAAGFQWCVTLNVVAK
jgi:hypothetical protein